MKTYILLIISFLSFNAFGIISYAKGDKLYCWAKSGLTIRKEPYFKSSKIGLIPFNHSLTSQDFKDSQASDFPIVETYKGYNTEIDTLQLFGTWVKIKFGTIEGFVFDAYLSHLSAPIGNEHFNFFNQNYELVAQKRDTTIIERQVKTLVWSNGSSYRSKNLEGGSEFRYILPDISMEEAIILFNTIYTDISSRNQESKVYIVLLLEMGELYIEKQGNIILVTGFYGC